ncbi:MAG: RNA polymerase sigma factor SigJ [Caulobacteraceae bacterium]|nr:RNA polymerase sigma factor SigJ [Caulobacteraceae bacterium]
MSDLAIFQAQRPRLGRLAYRMLGSVAEAEDVLQDAWLRWSGRSPEAVEVPAAFLVRAVTRLCLDRLRAARARRQAYKGPWLPEPLVEAITEDPLERAEDISVAFLLALERLSPLERAVFLLHDVFEADYGAVAKALGRSEAACRQLAGRARAHVRDARPRFDVSQEAAARLATAFMDAARRGDFAALSDLLAEDAVLISDGGGKRKAALRPMVGREDVIGLIKGLSWRGGWPQPGAMRLARINGYLGVILEAADGIMTIAFEPAKDGKLAAIYLLRNPDKLAHLARSSAD